MSVNSAFTGFSNNRWVMRYGTAAMLLVIFFISSAFKKNSARDSRVKQVNLIIRQIGHRLLLQSADSTSRVLPVTEIKDGTFLLKFENEFVFNHDSLMVMSQDLLPKTQFQLGYTVTVHDCTKGDIVYGFQVNNTAPDILACKRRSQPAGCYTIEFAFPDLYENEEQKTSDIPHLPEAVKVYPQEVNSKPGELKTPTFHVDQQTKALKPIKDDLQEVNSNQQLKTSTFGYPSIKFVYAAVLVLFAVILLMGRFAKILKPLPVQDENAVIIKEYAPEFASLGKFLFNVKGQCLLLGSEVISLTDKECKVLEMLQKNYGELVPRETLLQKVWIDEGVITGRSLDMFVSKLRKKLSTDPELRITNVHGKGYKLEIPEKQII
jgi:hypothetical protein